MQSGNFSLNIALIGHVSVGKTTLLNAILGEKFAEVSKRRTTAGINHFHIQPLIRPNQSLTELKQEPDENKPSHESHVNIKTPNQTLVEITEDNIKLRNLNVIQNKHFDIELDDLPLKMRPDTSLCIIDIPGLNEAGTQDMYTSYVEESWDTYSCVIVVMDVSQGVNTDEQVKLLKFIDSNTRTKQNIPIIVVCNKVDDVEDTELMELVNEVQVEVNRIFNRTINREDALFEALYGSRSEEPFFKFAEGSPAFLHLSAENAFIYRSIASLTVQDFSTNVDQSHIDRVGNREFGYMRWRKMNSEEKCKAIHDLVSDPNEYEERLAMTNFNKLMQVLRYFLEGDENQKYLISKKIEIELYRLTKETSFVERLSQIHDYCVKIDKDSSILAETFWSLFDDCKFHYMSLLEDDPQGIKTINIPMQKLVSYHEFIETKFVKDVEKEFIQNEQSRVMKEMKKFVDDYISLVVTKVSDRQENKVLFDPYFTCCGKWQNMQSDSFIFGTSHPHPDKYDDCWEWKELEKKWENKHTKEKSNSNPAYSSSKGWFEMGIRDCKNILNSMLLMKYNQHFCDNFGRSILDLSWFAHKECETEWQKQCSICSKLHKKKLTRKYSPPLFIADKTSDVHHFGHIIWLYCGFAESVPYRT